ncbi:MAG: hypothetical protein ACM3US_02530 [Sphingomonadaceae bacterium]
MSRFTARRSMKALVSVPAALAVMIAVAVTAYAAPTSAISISDLTPANGSTAPANQEVEVSGFITSDSSILTESIVVSIDGSSADVQLIVGSRAERAGFRTTRAFTPGTHTLTVTATNTSNERTEASSAFTAVAGATVAPAQVATPAATAAPAPAPAQVAAPAPTQATAQMPKQLPAPGGLPLAADFPALLALGTALSLLGLRLRAVSGD